MSERKRRKLKSKLRLAVFLIVLAGLFAGGFAAANSLLWPLLTGKSLVDLSDDDAGDLAKMPGINVLMMGVDERSDDASQRTDTIILANINNKENRLALLSIPRDTKVDIPGHGVNKINAANIFGGPELAMQEVSELTGVNVDYYVLTNFNGFKDIVDALGGVTVDVEKNMDYAEGLYNGVYDIHLTKGVQRLNGTQALMYARFRNDELGDISRTQRQLKLLKAIGNEAMQPSSIAKLPKLVPEIYKNVDTNLGLSQMIALAKAAKNLNNVQIVTQTMPGWFLDEHGASYWYVDPSTAKQVATALFEEGKVVEVVQGALKDGQKPTQVALENVRPVEQAKENDSGAESGNTTNNNYKYDYDTQDYDEPYTGEYINEDSKEDPLTEGDNGGAYTNNEQQSLEEPVTDIFAPALPESTNQPELEPSEHVDVIINTYP
ncbi:putative transcriptional regulator YvhJ [Sporotomaculum syntrophicum]|uniref:Transcriptional regulator YvhJ n=1 Tax=Sporotomaculum syntrophicum TaxID=182264 RepID=A0A9D3AYG9_9FIRM|nr:LCP family protein [Sporotomaculum syntrophicum]KAF1086067.1 putative transcriptional regulator YvhJ [Sporotomaculum syntrophicum]